MVLMFVVAAVAAWVTVMAWWLWRYQERIVYQPPALVAEAPAPARRVEFRDIAGEPRSGFLIMPGTGGQETHTVVVAFHGNADLAAFVVPWAVELADRAGVTVFVPEYPGYGGSAGTPTYASLAACARGALAFARDRFPSAAVVLFGHSLGSAVASDLAAGMAPKELRALALQSPFTSARAMAMRLLIPRIPGLWQRVSRIHYDTRSVVAGLDVPVWVAHGTEDHVVPPRMGPEVFGAARKRGELLVVEGAGHNDVPEVGGERYWSWLTRAVSPRLVELEEERGRRLP